jgi:hypothetical protein
VIAGCLVALDCGALETGTSRGGEQMCGSRYSKAAVLQTTAPQSKPVLGPLPSAGGPLRTFLHC